MQLCSNIYLNLPSFHLISINQLPIINDNYRHNGTMVSIWTGVYGGFVIRKRP
jgi:hypothetical protein